VSAASAGTIGAGRVAATTSAGSASGSSLACSSLWQAAWEAAAQQSLPLVSNLLVEAIGDEDEEALKRSDQRHQHQEDNVENVDLGQDGVEEGEEPRQADSYEDRHEHPEFLAILTLFCFWRLGESAVNLARDEEEEHGIDADEDEARQEEKAKDNIGSIM